MYGRADLSADDLDLTGASMANGTDGVIYTGVDADGQLGNSALTGVGDLNGDGLADFAFTAPRAQTDPGNQDALEPGRTYVIFGSTNRTALNAVTLGGLDGTDGFMLEVDALQDLVPGFVGPNYQGEMVVGGAGDVNGDGFDDFAIGAPAGGEKEPGSAGGKAHLFFGTATPTWGDETPLDQADVTWEGADNDDLGFNIIGPGDWNGDGFDDLVIAAPQTAQGTGQAGRVYIVFGRPSGWPAPGPIADDSGVIEVSAEIPNGKFGTGLAAVGDVNNDGLPDFAVGAPLGNGNPGKTFLFFGRTDAIVALPATDASVVTLSPDCATCFGSVSATSLAGIGDVNDDGIDDFAIGAPQARPDDGDPLGRVYVVHGRDTWNSHIDLEAGPTLGAATIIVGTIPSGELGVGLTGGDLTGDGISDLLVGAPHNDDNPFDKGRFYVFAGSAAGWDAVIDADDADFKLEGTSALESVGYTPALGDFDGDGDLDLALGCPEAAGLNDPLARSGRLYLINDPPSAWSSEDPQDVMLSVWEGNEYPQWVGESVSVAGDINGDGYDDILVGANKSSIGASRAGATYLLLGGEASTLEN